MKKKHELLSLMNVGKAVFKDLTLLKITSIKDLAKQDADEMYARIQKITGTRHDPCVWDTYAAIVHEARTGEKKPWWHWSKIRKNKK